MFTVENLVALLTLTGLEIVLGIDNIVFIAILVAKLEKAKQDAARKVGLVLAMFVRILLLLAIRWIMQLSTPLFELLDQGISGRDIILIVGGLFLIGKATFEIHDKLEGSPEFSDAEHRRYSSYGAVLVQIVLLDIVFSLDSVITAVGMANNVLVMATAIVVAVMVMIVFSKSVSDFIDRNPTFKILALSFLLLVGVVLIVEGFGGHVDRGYIYFAMAFSLFVEAMNTKMRRTTIRET